MTANNVGSNSAAVDRLFSRRVICKIKGRETRYLMLIDDVRYFLEDGAMSLSDIEVISANEGTPEELAEMIGDELESSNHHSLTGLATALLTELQEEGLLESEQTTVLKALYNSLSKTVGI